MSPIASAAVSCRIRQRPDVLPEALEELRKNLPASELVFIPGGDALAHPDWKDAAKDPRTLALLAITPQAGRIPRDESWRAMPGFGERIMWLEMEPLSLSSTGVRARVRRGASV